MVVPSLLELRRRRQEIDARIDEIQDEIESLKAEWDRLHGEWMDVQGLIGRWNAHQSKGHAWSEGHDQPISS